MDHHGARRRACGGLLAVLAAGLAFAATPVRAQEFVMKFATQTINDLQHEYIKVYKRELEKATNNRIRVDVYPASQLGAAQRQTEGLRLGTIEGAIGPAELFVGADPRFQALAMPGLFNSVEHARRALNVPALRQAIYDVAAQRNLVGIGGNVYDLQGFVFKSPVAKLADFTGKRVRVLASEGEQAQVVALGGSAVPMALPEVMPALQQGTIDGVNSVKGVFVAFKYHDAAPNLLDTQLWALVSIALVSKVWYDRLPADLQKAVRETGSNIEPELDRWQVERIAKDTKDWADRGGRIAKLSAARAGGGGTTRHRGDPADPRQERAAQGVLQQGQSRGRHRELTDDVRVPASPAAGRARLGPRPMARGGRVVRDRGPQRRQHRPALLLLRRVLVGRRSDALPDDLRRLHGRDRGRVAAGAHPHRRLRAPGAAALAPGAGRRQHDRARSDPGSGGAREQPRRQPAARFRPAQRRAAPADVDPAEHHSGRPCS